MMIVQTADCSETAAAVRDGNGVVSVAQGIAWFWSTS